MVLSVESARRKLTSDKYDLVILNLLGSSEETLQAYESLKAAEPGQQIAYVRGRWSSPFSQPVPEDLLELDEQPEKLLEQLRAFAIFGHHFAGSAGGTPRP